MQYKPYKIKLSKGDSKGMYLLANKDEIKLDKADNIKAPNRIYKIQIEVEAIHNNKRCRGKKIFSVPKGTSMVKACLSMISNRINMIETLKEKGTLKVDKIVFESIDNNDRKFKTCFEKFIQNRKIATRKYGKPASDNTIRNYTAFYKRHLSIFDNREVDSITANDIEKLRNSMLEAKLKPATIKPMKVIMKQILDEYDVIINWNKIIFPTPDNIRKYDRDIVETIKIVNILYNYLPEGSTRKYEINAIFKLLLTGRRISECTELKYEYLDIKRMMIRYPKTATKTKREYEFILPPDVLEAIKKIAPLKTKGNIFTIHSKTILVHFKAIMDKMGIHDMVLHDIRSLVAQTALNNGATLFDVATMLSHTNTKTTETRYIQGNSIQSANALSTFKKAISDEIIDVEVIEDEFTQLKKIYPHATDTKIYEIIDMMKI